MKFKFLLIWILFLSLSLLAQNKFTINGFIKSAQTGESLIGATISILGSNKNIASNLYGFYSITLLKGEYNLVCTYAGYQSKIFAINLNENIQLNFELLENESLSEVVITSKKKDANVKEAQMGKFTLPIDKIKSMPAFLGEVDILKAIQLLPGVRNAGEGSAGFYVRGGGADQNLVLLDDAPVYNTGHLFGFFSVFNADAIKNVTLIKGGMPAQYGGRLSSVLDVSMKEGNNQKLAVDAGIGLIASRLSIQGPIIKNKASFIVSARRTYIDVLAKPFLKKTSQFNGSGYYFYDVNAKMNFKFSEKNRLYLSGYFGKDVFDFANGKRGLVIKIPWGNSTATLRWNHVFTNKLFANTTAVFNDYKFEFNGEQSGFKLKLKSGISDLSLKQDFDFYPFSAHKIKFGGIYTFHTIIPSIVSGTQDSIVFNPINAQKKYAHDIGLYLQDDWDVSSKLKLNLGLRYSLFEQVGPYEIYTKDANGNILDTTNFSSGKKVKMYGGLEPRFTFRYQLNEATSLKGSVTRNLQYIHLVSNAGTTLPTDIWVPSTYKVKPQISWQYALGLFKNFKDNMYETSIELYYKSMQHQIEYKEGYTPSTLDDTENSFTFGKGWSYGSELFINKAKGKLTGWLGYTLSWTYRKFDNLNDGNKYPAKYDRRHDMSLVAMYELSKKWKLSATFVYGSGNAATLPKQFYIFQGVLTQQYSNINEYRLPAYHRLDFAAILTPKKNEHRKLKTQWVFSVYNVYSRKNPYFIYFDQTGSVINGDLKIQAKQVSLFPIIPSITWNVKF